MNLHVGSGREAAVLVAAVVVVVVVVALGLRVDIGFAVEGPKVSDLGFRIIGFRV